MKAKLTMLFAALAVLLMLPTGCKKEGPDALLIKTTWPGDFPGKYVLRLGSTETEFTSANAEYPTKLKAGKYDYLLFNPATGLTIEGNNATVDESAGFAVSPAFFYANSGNVSMIAGKKSEILGVMQPMVRQLNLTLSIANGDVASITSIEGQITGIAKKIDMMTGEVSETTKVAPVFAKASDKYKNSYNLLGVIDAQELTLKVTTTGGVFESKVDLTEAMASFNSDKSKSRDIELSVAGVGVSTINVSVISWNDGSITPAEGGVAPMEKQITIDWNKANNIEAITIETKAGDKYMSYVKNGVTTGLYELPADILFMTVYMNDGLHDVSASWQSYTDGVIKMSNTNYYLRSAHDLTIIYDLSRNITLMNDIDCSGYLITPLGTEKTPYSGTFDGNGKKLSNVSFDDSQYYKSLIGFNKGTIKNLTIESIVVPNNASNVAPICGMNTGVVSKCTNKASITTTGTLIGGIVVDNISKISECENSGNISGNSMVAGIVANNYQIDGKDKPIIENCINNGAIDSKQDFGGGIVAQDVNGQIVQCNNNGNISSVNAVEKSYIGGIVGNSTKTIIVACLNQGKIAGGGMIGGIIGFASGVIVDQCYNAAKGEVTGKNLGIGGIVGYGQNQSLSFKHIIANCGNYAKISMTVDKEATGGIAGWNNGSILGSKNAGEVVSLGRSVAGICGKCDAAIMSSYNNAPISGPLKNLYYTGGISGYKSVYSGVSGTYNLGNIVGTYSGALSGMTDGYFVHSYAKVGSNAVLLYTNNALEPEHVVGVDFFNYDANTAENNVWPVENVETGWGIYNPNYSTDPEQNHTYFNGYFWESLGQNGTNPVYPKLWWEKTIEPNLPIGSPIATVKSMYLE